MQNRQDSSAAPRIIMRDVVRLNNQNTVLLNMKIGSNLFLMHDNRIFVFKRTNVANTYPPPDEQTSLAEDNVILNLLTSPFYRTFTLIYLLFSLGDRISLLIIMILSFIEPNVYEIDDVVLFCAFALEIFFISMQNTYKYWPIQRLNFLIGLVFFGIYVGVIALKSHLNRYSLKELLVVGYLLAFRFFSYVQEVGVDFLLDGFLHNELFELSRKSKESMRIHQEREDLESTSGRSSMNISVTNSGLRGHVDSSDQFPDYMSDCSDILLDRNKPQCYLIAWFKDFFMHSLASSREINLPMGVTYEGSIFAWGPNSVFDWERSDDIVESNFSILKKNKFRGRTLIYCTLFIPIVVSSIFIFCIFILAVIAFSMMSFFYFLKMLWDKIFFATTENSLSRLHFYFHEMSHI